MKLLNIGCGSTFDTRWVNVDVASNSPDVQEWDLCQGIPYPDAYFDVCYHSHFLEHLTQEQAKKLLAECARVLKPEGILRVVVPNLEEIVKNYLEILSQLDVGKLEAIPNYDWIMLELYDQSVRNFSEGEMGRYLKSPNLKNKEFILSRIGDQADQTWQSALEQPPSFWTKMSRKKPVWLWQKLRYAVAKIFVVLIAGKQAGQAFESGIFRNSGEIHHWMYDRFSLRRLLEQSGFVDIKVCQAEESQIDGFSEYGLEVIDGRVRKPDSLYMEGIKN